MSLFTDRALQLGFFFLWFAIVLIVYVYFGELEVHEAFRYTFDVGFNTGTGVGNISEKNEYITMWSIIVMWSGQIFVTLVWSDFIAFMLGKEESMASTMFRDFLSAGRQIAEKSSINGEWIVYFVTLLWITVGTIWGMAIEKFSAITALNYAVGIMSSTGSQTSANKLSSNVFTGFYLLTGVPMFAIMTATFIEHMKRLSKEKSVSRNVERPKRVEFKPLSNF